MGAHTRNVRMFQNIKNNKPINVYYVKGKKTKSISETLLMKDCVLLNEISFVIKMLNNLVIKGTYFSRYYRSLIMKQPMT